MKNKTFMCYNMLMDKKSVVRKRFNYQAKAKCALLTGVVLGLLMICLSAVQLYDYHRERGSKTTEELTSDSEKYSIDAGKLEAEKNKEFEENGPSEKYLELSEKWAEEVQKKTKAEHSMYMDETGYHNPRNLWEFVTTVPLLFVGFLCLVAGFVANSVIKEKGKKELAEEKKKAEKEKEKKEEKK